jgi:hypothetical protein
MGSLTTIPRAAGASARMERNERCIFGLRIQFKGKQVFVLLLNVS